MVSQEQKTISKALKAKFQAKDLAVTVTCSSGRASWVTVKSRAGFDRDTRRGMITICHPGMSIDFGACAGNISHYAMSAYPAEWQQWMDS